MSLHMSLLTCHSLHVTAHTSLLTRHCLHVTGPHVSAINIFLSKGDLCRNRRLRNADYASCVPFYTGNRGWGLKAAQPIEAGEFVVEYVGEVIDEGMCRERLQRYHEEGKQSFYILSLAKGLYIDAAAKANKARWVAHTRPGGWCTPG